MDVKMDVNRNFEGFSVLYLGPKIAEKCLILLGILLVSAEGLEPSTP